MSDYTVVLEDNIEIGIDAIEQNNLVGKLGSQKATARFVTKEGHNFLIGKVLVIWKNVVEEPVAETEHEAEPAAFDNEMQEDSEDAEIVARRDAAEKDLLAKSRCKHEEKELFVQTVETKKGGSKRFFPVCSFCGQRFRYVKADDLSDEEKANAKEWVE